MDLTETERTGEDRWDRWKAFVYKVMNLRVPYNAGKFLTGWATVSFSNRTLFHVVSQSDMQYNVPPTTSHMHTVSTMHNDHSGRLAPSVSQRVQSKRNAGLVFQTVLPYASYVCVCVCIYIYIYIFQVVIFVSTNCCKGAGIAQLV